MTIFNFYSKPLIVSLFLLFTFTSAFAHWTSKGPYGGSVSCMMVNDTNIFVGTHNGGVFRSTNSSGTTWRYYNYTGLGSGKITAMASLGGKVLAGTADKGVFLSADMGVSWKAMNQGLTEMRVTAMAGSGDTLYAGTETGVYVSTDSAKSWTAMNTGMTAQRITALITAGGYVYAGTWGNGMYYMDMTGSTWNAMSTGLTSSNITCLASFGAVVFAGTDEGVYKGDVSLTGWTKLNSGFGGDMYINSLALNSTSIFAGTNAGVYGSSVTAINWAKASGNMIDDDTVSAMVMLNGSLFAGTKEGGIFVGSVINTSWKQSNTGLNNLKGQALACKDSIVVSATNKGVFVSADVSATYKMSNKGLTDSLHVSCLAIDGSNFYAGTLNGGMFMSSDMGANWLAINTSLPDMSVNAMVITQNKIYAATSSGKLYSTSKGTISWATADNGLPGSMNITAFAATGTDVYLATAANGVYITADGSNWTAFNTGLSNKNVSSLCVAGDSLFAGTHGSGVFATKLSADVWQAMNSGLPDMDITSLGATGKYVLAGYKGGVYASYNMAATWESPNILLYIPAYAEVKSMAFTSERIFVATPDNSMYSNSKAELPEEPVSISPEEEADNIFSIAPNPNSGVFQIKFMDPGMQSANIHIYDISGRLVSQVNGNTTVNCNFPKGLYFVKLQTPEKVYSQKMIIQ